MNRIEVIQKLIAIRGCRRYLEIGCQKDVCFSKIDVPVKVGVDPQSGGTLRMGSDEFFAMAREPFDLIFVDGDHHHDQVFRDVCHALRLLTPAGVLVMHDCLPPDARHEGLDLCGTAWRAFAKIRERLEYEAWTCDFDYGVGVVQCSTNSAPIKVGRPMSALTYADFVANRSAWMRPQSAANVVTLIEAMRT